MLRQTFQQTAISAALLLALTACDSSTHSNEGKPQPIHEHPKVENAGRLVLSTVGSNSVYIYDIKDKKQIGSFDAQLPTHSIYASPDRRYALLFQRVDNQVRFIDGGLWQEDHGDHLHDYQQNPLLSAFIVKGPAPTHYEVHARQAAIFFDGVASPLQPSSVSVLTDASITQAKVSASLQLPLNMHGTAEPRGTHLLTTFRPADASNTLPTQVEWYQQNGDSFTLKERFSEQCPGLHGSYSVKDYSLFGCTDGVLVVQQKAGEFSAVKLPNPVGMTGRIGTITGHKTLTQTIGFAGQDMYLIDPVALTMTKLDWRQGSTATRTAYAFSGDGDYLAQLDNSGKLVVQDVAAGYAIKATLQLLTGFETANPPVIAVNNQNDEIYVTDPTQKQLHRVDLKTMASSILPLEFTPAKMTWLGIAKPAP
ncbi:hypothetical protein EOE67_19835 [Rheinheimera riviphila]|uniref:Uncharacterized protein n=1 Tax=Rheinheimera riviphila TaxID=1834037 RepID=A0A437QBI3_9GAMM|nr:hypothetical protein [Rheinheimera riviphila]RVU31886.1 hypothetical protein EOE67_19835 [Rheinheimera riviphila]